MDILRGPFDFTNNITYEDTEIFVNQIQKYEEGNMDSLKKLDTGKMMDVTLNRNTKIPMMNLRFYNGSIKRNSKNSIEGKSKKNEVNITSNMSEDAKGQGQSAKTIDENLIIKESKNNGPRYKLVNDKTIDEVEEVKHYIWVFREYQIAFEKLEYVDLSHLVMRSLQGVQNAVQSLRKLVRYYGENGRHEEKLKAIVSHHEPFNIVIEKILKAKEEGYDVFEEKNEVV
ncbi:hypothetical protein [Bacillus toyonensis]|uniref:hypothetical protein n=1 Tax=Bacillus toyonensis TaxID=155322 RepID=UPI000BF498ED|nr:hypothetical protein [Bacillus toyonensis]PGF05256.1 hypothetical protein COM61_02260 [Bacillus toyonensis]